MLFSLFSLSLSLSLSLFLSLFLCLLFLCEDRQCWILKSYVKYTYYPIKFLLRKNGFYTQIAQSISMQKEKNENLGCIVYDSQCYSCYVTYTNLFTNTSSFYIYLFYFVKIKSCILICWKADTKLPLHSLEHINTKLMFHYVKFQT